MHFVLASGEPFGTPEERSIAQEFSRRLAATINENKAGIFDGDEYGEGQGALFMYGPNADRLFDVVSPLLNAWGPLKGGYLIKRYGVPERSERIDY